MKKISGVCDILRTSNFLILRHLKSPTLCPFIQRIQITDKTEEEISKCYRVLRRTAQKKGLKLLGEEHEQEE